MNASPKLTFKQQRFVEEYQVDGNGSQAVLRAGYKTNYPAEMAKLPPSLSVSFDTSPDELARQIHLLLGERFLKKLGQCLRQEVPLSIRETYELVQEVTTVQERYCLAALLAGDRYRLG